MPTLPPSRRLMSIATALTAVAVVALALYFAVPWGSGPAEAHEVELRMNEEEPRRLPLDEALNVAEDALDFEVRIPDVPDFLELRSVQAHTGPPGLPHYDTARAVLVYRAVDDQEAGIVGLEVEQITRSEHGIAPAPGAVEVDSFDGEGVRYTLYDEGGGPGGENVELAGFSAIPDDPGQAFSYVYRIGFAADRDPAVEPSAVVQQVFDSQLR